MTILSLPTNRRAARSVARAHADRALQLVTLLTAGGAVDHRPLAAAALRRVATCRSLSRREFELVAAAVDVCAAHSDPEAPERLVLLLTDVDGWAEAEVGDALGLEIDDVARLRASARARVGAERLARRECRGWGLVGRRSGLTPQETAAADAHRALCWPCRERLREQRRVRERLETRSAAVTATVLADVVALTVPAGGATTAGIVGATASKVATAVVGAGALAVAVTSAGLAVARVHPAQPAQPQQTRQVQPHQPSDRSVPVRPLVTGAAEPASAGPASGEPASQLPVKPALPPLSARPQLPASLTVPTLVPTALPTLLPAAIPTALPTLLPTPLQSLLPTALPTSIPTVPLSLGGTP